MTNYFNQQDINSTAGSMAQSAFKKAPIIVYDVIKWLINFIKSMWKMVTG